MHEEELFPGAVLLDPSPFGENPFEDLAIGIIRPENFEKIPKTYQLEQLTDFTLTDESETEYLHIPKPENFNHIEINSYTRHLHQNIKSLNDFPENKLNNKNLYDPYQIPKLLDKNSINSVNGSVYQIANFIGQTITPSNAGNGIWTPSDYIDFDALKPQDLPEIALPVLEFMEEVQPHIVIGCDRGGRLFSLAMHAAWRETREGAPFPTLDGKIHFARVSKSENPDVLQAKIDQIVMASKKLGVHRGNHVDEDEQLRVMFVDDWVTGGGTKKLAERLMEKHDAQTYFAVMCGGNADASGMIDRNTFVSWHDRPEEIGVNYLSTLEEAADGSYIQRHEAVAVRGEAATINRRKIQNAAKQLVATQVLVEVA